VRKVCVVVANRANYGRIKSALAAIQEHAELELALVVASSTLLDRFGQAIKVIQGDGFEPVATIRMIVEGETPETMAKSAGLCLLELPTIFEMVRPDIVLVIADRFETLPISMAAAYMNIPVAHTQGGEITGSIDESVRHATTKLAHVHFPATELSRDRVIRMGENPEHVHWVGCPSIDLARGVGEGADRHLAGYEGPMRFNTDEPYLMVTQHPVTTEFADAGRQMEVTLEALRRIGMPTVLLYPNVDAGSELVVRAIRRSSVEKDPNFHCYKNFPPEVYMALQSKCACQVGNSSSGLREGTYFGTPVVNIGTRQAGRERGDNVVDADFGVDAIQAAVRDQLDHGRYPQNDLFGDGTAGRQIAEVLSRCPLTVQKKLAY